MCVLLRGGQEGVWKAGEWVRRMGERDIVGRKELLLSPVIGMLCQILDRVKESDGSCKKSRGNVSYRRTTESRMDMNSPR